MATPRLPATQGQTLMAGAAADELDRTYPDNLTPFLAVPKGYGTLYDNQRRVGQLLLYALAIPALLCAISGIHKSLWTQSPLQTSILADVAHFLFRTDLKVAAPDKSAEVPLLRDYPAILLVTTFTLSIPLVYYLYSQLALLYGSLHTNGCLTVRDATGFKREREILNDQFKAWGRYWWVVAGVSLAIAALMYWVLFNFHSFGPWAADNLPAPESSAWLRTARSSWWASIHKPFRLGSVVWVLTGAGAIYSFAGQSFIGWSWQRHLGRLLNKVEFRPTWSDPDGVFGWRRLRNLVAALLFGSLPLSTSAGLAIFLMFRARVGIFPAATVMSLFIANIALCLVRILAALRRNIALTRRADILALTTDLRSYTDQTADALAMRTELRDEIERVTRLPLLPLGRPTIAASFALAALPIVAAILDIASSLTK
jgi:hypothetical protein